MWAMNTLDTTVYERQFWRIFTAPLVHPNILMLLFVLLAYIPTGVLREKMVGTVKIATGFFLMNVLIQLTFLVFSFGASRLTEHYTFFHSLGMWPIIMAEIVIEYNRNPESEMKFCCFPCGLKAKYHPWIYIIIFAIINPYGAVSLVAGFFIGHLYVYGVLSWIQITDE
jgi:membrane associated rhomboid family serine protease